MANKYDIVLFGYRVEQAGPLTDSSGSVLPRDLTELMVPREIGWERAGHKMVCSF